MCVCERGRKREIERQREKNSKVHKFPGKMSYISYLSLCLIFSLSMRPSHSISCVNICIENQFVNSFFSSHLIKRSVVKVEFTNTAKANQQIIWMRTKCANRWLRRKDTFQQVTHLSGSHIHIMRTHTHSHKRSRIIRFIFIVCHHRPFHEHFLRSN